METYSQRKAAVRKALRECKRQLNLNNTLLEKCRRENDRLIDRKTLVTPDSILKLEQLWNSTVLSSNGTTAALTRLMVIARSYL